MKTLKITLQHADDSDFPVSATLTTTSGLSYRREGYLQFNDNWQTELLSLNLQPEAYGEYLGKAVFHEDIRDICKEALTGSEQVRLYLIIESPDLKALRWERLSFLDDTNAWTSLAQDQRLLFSYYTPSLSSRDYTVLHQRDLRALIMVYSPPETYHGFKPFDAESLAQQLEESMEDGIESTIVYKPDEATWPKLLEHLNSGAYSFLHIVCHGHFDAERGDNGQSFLLLSDAEQNPKMVSAREFTRPLKKVNHLPHLIFLSSCETATPAASVTPHDHFARHILDALGTPAVVAMSDKVSVQSATTLATHFYPHLYREAHVDLALAKAGLSLLEESDHHLPVLYQRLADTPLFTTTLKRIDELTTDERIAGLQKLAPLIVERAPTAQTEFDTIAKAAKTEPPDLLDLQNLDSFCNEIVEISFTELAQNADVPDYNSECPFPGMRPFKELKEDGETVDYTKYFFGRGQVVKELFHRMKNEPIIGVIGASGSGKSSLIFAGIIPKLTTWQKEQGKTLQTITIRPVGSEHQQQSKTPLQHLEKHIAELDPDQPTLLYVDQFEELFTLCQYDDKPYQEKLRKDFLHRLLSLPEQYPHLNVVFTIRDDFTGDAYDYPDLKSVLQDHAYPLARMNAAELRTAIEQQTNQVQLVFEQGLVHNILSEVEGEPGIMPLLQHLLWLLWKRRRGRYLRLAEYEAIGGVKKAISETADKLFEQYRGDTTTQRYLRNIFLRLTRAGKTSTDELEDKYIDTRQRVTRSSLYPSDAEPEIIDKLIKQLADERLIVTYKDDVEISHESLIKHWDKLRDWLKDRQLIEMQQRLGDASLAWHRAKKNHEKHLNDLLLHRGIRIEQLEQKKNQQTLFLNPSEEEYLQACRELTDREIRNTLWAKRAFLMLPFVFIFLIAAISALWIASEQKKTAANRLAEQYFQKGIELRDSPYQVWDKAEKYFSKALDITTDKEKKSKIQYSLNDMQRVSITPEKVFYHSDAINGAKIFANETRLLTWAKDGKIKIWDISTGENLGNTIHIDSKVHNNDDVIEAQFLKNEEKIIFWSEYAVELWDIKKGVRIGSPMKHNNEPDNVIFTDKERYINGVKLIANQSRIITWSEDQTVKIWDAKNSELIHTLEYSDEIVDVLPFFNDTRLLISSDNTEWLWNIETKKPIGQARKYGEKTIIFSEKFLNNDTKALTIVHDQGLYIWDSQTSETLEYIPYKERIRGAKAFKNNEKMIIWDDNSSVLILDIRGRKLTEYPLQNMKKIWDLKLFHNEEKILSLGGKGDIEIFSLTSKKHLTPIMHHERWVDGVKLSTNNKKILSWGYDGTARIWNAETGLPLTMPMRHKHIIRGATLFNNDKKILTWGDDGVAKIWDISNESTKLSALPKNYKINGSRQLADERHIVTWDSDGAIQILDVVTGREVGIPMKHDASVLDVKLFYNDTRLLAWSSDKIVQAWDLSTREKIGNPITYKTEVTDVTFINNESQVIIWDYNELQNWDIIKGEKVSNPMLHNYEVLGIKFIKNSTIFLTWDFDEIHIRNKENENSIIKLDQLKGRGVINNVETFADEKYLLGSISDGSIYIWDIKTGKVLDAFQYHLQSVQKITNRKLTNPIKHEYRLKSTQLITDEKLLIWGKDNTSLIWNIVTGTPIGKPMLHKEPVSSFTLFSDIKRLLTSCGNEVIIWDTTTGEKVGRPIRHKSMILGNKIFANDSRLLTWSEDKTVRIWDLSKRTPIGQAIDYDASEAILYAKNSLILTWGSERKIQLWDPITGSPVLALQLDEPIVHAELFANDSRVLIETSSEKHYIWNLPAINSSGLPLNELSQAISTGSYINSIGDWEHLLPKEIDKCKHLYDPFQQCENTVDLICAFKHQWWSVKKLFGQLPTIEDCLIPEGSSP